jgi:hypothetical protein
VTPSDLVVLATPPSLEFTAFDGGPAIASQVIDVTFNGEDLTLSAPSWLTVSRRPTSPASFLVSIDDPSPVIGTMRSGDVVFTTRRGTVQRSAAVHVDYWSYGRTDLAISATPYVLAFTAIAGAPVPPPQAAQVVFTGSSVEVVSAPSWLTVTAPAVPTSPASFAVSVNTTSFAGGTEQRGDIWFGTTRDGVQETTIIQVAYTLGYSPELLFVAPYVGLAGRGGKLYLRGRGLPTGHPFTVRIGESTFGPVNPDNDTLVTLNYPALPVGRYPVTLIDPPVASPRAPELVIVAPPQFTYQAIDAPGNPSRIIYDAERQMLYSTSWMDQRIKRFAYGNGSWTPQPAIAIPQLTEIAMAPDGRSLIVVDTGRINEMSLTDDLYVPVERARPPVTPWGTDSFFTAAAANNGKVFLPSNGNRTYFYDMIDHTLIAKSNELYGSPTASKDGSRIYARGDLGTFLIYDMLTGTRSSVLVNLSHGNAISVSADGSRVIMDGSQVYNGSLRLTGNVPYQDLFGTLVSHDGSRAFICPHDWIHPRIEVYDLNGPLLSGAMYPLLKTIPLPDSANGPNEYAMAMTSTPDDAVVFVAGASKLLVVPVN